MLTAHLATCKIHQHQQVIQFDKNNAVYLHPMKFNELVSGDVCQVAVEQSPARRATLNQRRQTVAEK